MRERRSVLIEKVREVLRKAGQSGLMEEVLSDARKPISLKCGIIKDIEAKINGPEGVVIVKRRKNGKGVTLLGSQHIKWNFHLNRVSKAEVKRLNQLALKKQGKRSSEQVAADKITPPVPAV